MFGSDEFADFLKIEPAINIIAVFLGLLLDYGMGTIPNKRAEFLWYLGISVSLQPSVELEVAHRLEFLLGRSRAGPERSQFRRAWSMDRTICPSRRIVYIAALQQLIYNAGRRAFES